MLKKILGAFAESRSNKDVEHGLALVDHDHRAFDARRELRAGDDHRDLEQALFFGVEAAHLAVDPDQVLVALGQGGGRGDVRGGIRSHRAIVSDRPR